MKITYFHDTDTAYLEFASRQIAETRALSDDLTIDLDEHGQVVALTIEHAATTASLPTVTVDERPARPSSA